MNQVKTLFEHGQKREVMKMKFLANLLGAEIKDDDSPFSESSSTDGKPPSKPEVFKFGDPEDYKKMPKEDQLKLRDKMMGGHKSWVHSRRKDGKPGPFA